MQWASVSILSNLAEGFESRTQPLFIEFLGVAKASADELRAQSYVALDVGHVSESEFDELVDLCKKCSGKISRFLSYPRKNPKEYGVQEASVPYDFEAEL